MCCAHAHKISRRLKISRCCIRQTIRKFDRYGTVATRPGAGRPKKTANRQTWLIKLEQIRDETNSLIDLVRYANTNMSLSISTLTTGHILRQYNMTFDRYGTVATRPGAGRPKKTANRQTWLIKLEQIRDETNSLIDLVRYANTNMSLSISTLTTGHILRQYNMTSYIASRKPRITPKQRRARIDWCNEHLS